MSRIAAVLVLTVMTLFAGVSVVAGAEPGDDVLRISSVNVDRHPLVTFTVSTPQHDADIAARSAFTVTEDGAARDAQVEWIDSTDVYVVLLIDTTGSMGGASIANARAAAASFIERVAEAAHVAVVSYDTTATVITDFSASKQDHLEGIAGLQASGRTAMFDAVSAAADLFAETGDTANRTIILLTDGEDNASSTTVEDVIEALTVAEVTLHSIEYQTAFTDEATIRAMVKATGGDVFEADDGAALATIYGQLASALSNRYRVEYTSERGGPTTLSVTFDHAGVRVEGSKLVVFPSLPVAADVVPVESASPAPPPIIVAGSAGLLGTPLALVVGALLWFAALTAAGITAAAPAHAMGSRGAQPFGRGGSAASKGAMSGFAHRATQMADRALGKHGRRQTLNTKLERAGLNMRSGEYIVLVISAAITVFAVSYLVLGPFAGAVLAIATVVAARVAVTQQTKRRQATFAEQLGGTLQLLSGSLRAGYSLMQAVDSVANEADAPTADEFRRLVVEVRLGRDMAEALDAMAERMESDDFVWVVQAIEIHRDIGGDLAEVLDTVAATIRERNQIRRQIRTLSAEGRISAAILLFLPLALAAFLFTTNRAYLAVLVEAGLVGWTLIGTAVVLMGAGVIWMRNLIKLEF